MMKNTIKNTMKKWWIFLTRPIRIKKYSKYEVILKQMDNEAKSKLKSYFYNDYNIFWEWRKAEAEIQMNLVENLQVYLYDAIVFGGKKTEDLSQFIDSVVIGASVIMDGRFKVFEKRSEERLDEMETMVNEGDA